uniref:2Fe-2S iron-sulfur cluster binding domain-containing protein n=1 Tax=Candidatus Kentrum sp. LPFa TaxID=2126335 RepID=A0A450VYE4_9GAMM|nr:MAG: 2Fe-2S iron-sulfur cluster binding domain-containing protein [Candidatus Kentron sp. LPFa]
MYPKNLAPSHRFPLNGSLNLDFLRHSQRLMGTKEGCREGACGSCLILVGETDGDAVSYRAINSCLPPLAEVDGKHVVTIEGLNDRNNRALNPIQQAIMIEGATQCGYYCTPGIVLALTGFFLGNPYPDENEAIAAISGNLCPFTGYPVHKTRCGAASWDIVPLRCQ